MLNDKNILFIFKFNRFFSQNNLFLFLFLFILTVIFNILNNIIYNVNINNTVYTT